MKKTVLIIIIALIAIVFVHDSKAQSNWEIGLRGGDNFSIDATIPIGAAPRLHPAIYFDRFGVATYFDWMFALSKGPKGLKFYPGVGPELWFGSRFDFNVAGNFGVEYSFDFPLTIGFDWRPGFQLTNGFDFVSDRWGFIARFRFAEGAKLEKAN